jgi:cholesterol oxidase
MTNNGSRSSEQHDVDWVVVGSGFGGSVSALRLAEKGYSVHVSECGRRYRDEDLPESTWQASRFNWLPRFGLRGILRLTLFKDVAILSGSGVGGGSLAYACTLYRGLDRFREHLNTAVGEQVDLDPYYDVAERMLGVVEQPRRTPLDALMIESAGELGYGDTFHPTRVGVFFGDEPGVSVADPFFGGEGPERTGCVECGSCMLGCRYGAKNTLMKNYLWLAERRGVRIEPERIVVDVQPIGAADGSDGYLVTTERPGAWRRKDRRTIRARGVVLGAGAIGTNLLLANCRASGSLPRLSQQLGRAVRTNSESIGAVTLRNGDLAEAQRSVSLTGSLFPSEDTHVEWVHYGPSGDSFGLLFGLLTGDGTRLTRPLKLLAQVLRHPIDALRSSDPRGWSKRSVMIGAMQSLDNSIRFVPRRRLFGGGVRLQTQQDSAHPNPTFIPEVHAIISRVAAKIDGIPQGWITEAANIPVTAHILGGAVIGRDPSEGAIDGRHRVFGYENLIICDGSSLPYNPGVNPSLTITAMAERAMAMIPSKHGTPHATGIGLEPLNRPARTGSA